MPSREYNWKKYKKSETKARMVTAYPSQKYYSLLETYRVANEMGQSETLNFIVRHFFDQLPAAEIDRLKSLAATRC